MPARTAFWIQFVCTVLATGAATFISSGEDLLSGIVAALGTAAAMAQKSAKDPRRNQPG